MKPFSLKRLLAGDPITTIEGEEPDDIAYMKSATSTNFKLVGVIKGIIHCWDDNGNSMTGNKKYTLFMKSIVKTYWQNIYSDGKDTWTGSLHYTEESAKSHIDVGNEYIKTLSFDVEI